MKVSTTVKGQFGILKFEVDKIVGIEAREFQESLVSLLEKNIRFVIIDLRGVKFVSSWGIGMLTRSRPLRPIISPCVTYFFRSCLIFPLMMDLNRPWSRLIL